MPMTKFSFTCTRSPAFRIVYSDDQNTWTEAASTSSHQVNPSVEWDFVGSHKYWRYEITSDWSGGPWYRDWNWEYCNGCLNGCQGLVELELYGEQGCGQGPPTECWGCEVGKFNDESGGSGCTDCASGKYADATGSTACQDCAAGQIASETGAGCM